MGFFDWLHPTDRAVQVLDDVIWLTKTAKQNGIARFVEVNAAGPDRPSVTLLQARARR